MAPETLSSNQIFSDKSDVWSFGRSFISLDIHGALGIVIYEVLARQEPYLGWPVEKVAHQVVHEKYQLQLPAKWAGSIEGRLMLKCLSFEREDRPSFKEISKTLAEIR